jgi:hypothetical protein
MVNQQTKVSKTSSLRSSIQTDHTEMSDDSSSLFLEGGGFIDAQGVLEREQRRNRRSTFATPKFHADLQALSNWADARERNE